MSVVIVCMILNFLSCSALHLKSEQKVQEAEKMGILQWAELLSGPRCPDGMPPWICWFQQHRRRRRKTVSSVVDTLGQDTVATGTAEDTNLNSPAQFTLNINPAAGTCTSSQHAHLQVVGYLQGGASIVAGGATDCFDISVGADSTITLTIQSVKISCDTSSDANPGDIQVRFYSGAACAPRTFTGHGHRITNAEVYDINHPRGIGHTSDDCVVSAQTNSAMVTALRWTPHMINNGATCLSTNWSPPATATACSGAVTTQCTCASTADSITYACTPNPNNQVTECVTGGTGISAVCYNECLTKNCNAPHGNCRDATVGQAATCACQSQYSGPECATYTAPAPACTQCPGHGTCPHAGCCGCR